MAPALPMSPQKRVTRARAAAKKAGEVQKTTRDRTAPRSSTRKKTEVTEEDLARTDMPVTDEPLRKSARRVAAAAPARRIKVTALESSTVPQQQPVAESETSRTHPKPRATRSKKANTQEDDLGETETAVEPVRPKRQASGTLQPKEAPKAAASRLRGRPKKAEVAQNEVVAEGGNTKKQARARLGSATTDTGALTIPPSKGTVPKKKVTFQDVPGCDKENQPVSQAKETAKAKSGAPASGIRAKPVRRPVAKSRTNVKKSTIPDTAEETAQRILTPKKVTQVAKSCSSAESEEDELNGAKTPIRDLAQSPRRNVNIASMVSPVKKLDFGSGSLASSPVKSQLTSNLLSPAKRPVSSPFKEAFKESPKRSDIPFKIPQALRQTEAYQGRDMASSSTILLQSPKRVALEPSMFPQSTSKAVKSPFKASLLQSPPKRPISPVKTPSIVSTTKGIATSLEEVETDTMSSNIIVSSHFRASQSPQWTPRVHRMTPEDMGEEERCAIDFDESVVDIRSPLKLGMNTIDGADHVEETAENRSTPKSDLSKDDPTIELEVHSGLQHQVVMKATDTSKTQHTKDLELGSAAPASIMPCDQTPLNAASFLFRVSHLRDDDESSEDELQSPVRTLQTQTPATVLGSKSRMPIANPPAVDHNPGFTPLAAQLSGWLASSPDKQAMNKYRPRGIFSPVAAQHVRGEVVIDRHSPATSRVSVEPRLSTSARKSFRGRKSLGLRSSLASSVNGTPDKSSYFADEMAVKDLEEAIEGMEAEDSDCDMKQQFSCPESAYDAPVDDLAPTGVVEEMEFVESQRLDGSAEAERQNVEDVVAEALGEASRNCSAEIEAQTVTEEEEDRQHLHETSQVFPASSTYGDENNVPVAPTAAMSEPVLAETQETRTTPAATVFTENRAPLNDFNTPLQSQPKMPQFANTVVSKVPLRPEGHTSPIKVSKKRSRSLSSGPSSVKKAPVLQAFSIPQSRTVNSFSPMRSEASMPSSTMTTPGQQSFAVDDFGDSTLDGIEIDEDDENLPPITPTAASVPSLAVTLSKTPKAQTPATSSGVLQGAVVFVDVHTTEGADASGIFIELLTQMGAKCVKTWSWNPRASMGVNANANAEEAGAAVGNAKIGITHVVYKDGGKRTLEKVRDTEGLVKCVGVGWVLDCERENRWLDESAYAVDISILPRGGSRRRKSMEPRALLNMNGTLSKATGAAAGRRSVSAEMMQKLKDELVNTPVRRHGCDKTSDVSSQPREEDAEAEAEAEFDNSASIESGFSTPTGVFAISTTSAADLQPATPTGFVNYDPSTSQTPGGPNDRAADGDAASYSPTTPYYLAQGAKLVQMTCPPKQTRKGLFEKEDQQGQSEEIGGGVENGKGGSGGFPISGQLDDVKDARFRKRLADARRRTMGWRPAVASPLGR
ncbi:hypothetical protein GJ744_000571 [Endocarpon pusillum]|uniref:BRCT domain-containing protein n=1 Tax=Endocarpon pusillum TaxID=364733 RepID=A0A8H7AEH5_9EURO|nr:hypothetical protein GJ744_000571 [Endocarpon pusillum]